MRYNNISVWFEIYVQTSENSDLNGNFNLLALSVCTFLCYTWAIICDSKNTHIKIYILSCEMYKLLVWYSET